MPVEHDYIQPISSDPNLSAANAPEVVETPPIDPAYVQQVEARAAAAERAAQEANARATQLSVAQANAQYEAKKRQALEAAKETGDVEAVTQFYESDRQNRDQQVQQALMGAVVTRYRDDLKGRYGLREDQMIYLGENPEMMEARAQGLAQQNQQALAFQQSLDNAFLGQQAHERTMMNADRIGGSRGGAGRPEPTYEKGSMDHLRELMYGDSQVLIP